MKDGNGTGCLIEVLRILNEIMSVKCFAWCLAHSKHKVAIVYYYYIVRKKVLSRLIFRNHLIIWGLVVGKHLHLCSYRQSWLWNFWEILVIISLKMMDLNIRVFWFLAAIEVEKIMELGDLHLRELLLYHLVALNMNILLSLWAIISSSIKWEIIIILIHNK